jgi:RHS repeat-associated protein
LIKEVFDHYDDSLDQTLFFEYDRVGNRLQQQVDKGNNGTIDEIFEYSYDVNDRLIDELFDGQNDGIFEKQTNYGFDNTQQISKTVTENNIIISETTFEYDLQGRMSIVTITTESETEKTTYAYDSNGIRVSAIHEANGIITKTEYLNDSQSLTGYSQVLRQTEFDTEGNIIKTISYVIGHQRISQIIIENGTEQEYYFTFDGHGSTRALLDFTSAIIQLYSFDAYGNAIGFNPADALTEFLYSGEQFDSKIGQQYLRQRYYDPATGRFNRLDPFFGNLTDPQSFHKYLYTHANPVNRIDPSGLMSLGGAMMSGAIIGGIAGMSVGVGISVYNNNPILSWQTAKNAGIGLVLGASVGAAVGGGAWLYGHGLLGTVVNKGFSGLWTKIINPGGHSTTARWMAFGACVGFLTGFYEPNALEGFSALNMFGSTTVTTFTSLNAVEMFRGAARGSQLRQLMSLAQIKFLNRTVQSISFVTMGFTFGLTIGYGFGVLANQAYTYAGGDPEQLVDDIYDYSIGKIAEWSLLVF